MLLVSSSSFILTQNRFSLRLTPSQDGFTSEKSPLYFITFLSSPLLDFFFGGGLGFRLQPLFPFPSLRRPHRLSVLLLLLLLLAAAACCCCCRLSPLSWSLLVLLFCCRGAVVLVFNHAGARSLSRLFLPAFICRPTHAFRFLFLKKRVYCSSP